jgi:transposase-like protein
MNKKTPRSHRDQSKNASLDEVLRQLTIPMIAGIEATKRGLLAFVHEMGLAALDELLAAEAEALAGPKGKQDPQRTSNHWGTAPTRLPFGGRHVTVQRPRVRATDGTELILEAIEQFRKADPLPHRVAEQVAAGVSTRRYHRTLEPVPEQLNEQGTSKSAASRALVDITTAKLNEFLRRPLGEHQFVALFLDGVEFAGTASVVALGVTTDGTKVPLGVWLGSTENAVIATELLQDLLDRGLRVDGRMLCIIDGGKGIRKALRDVFGDRAVVQRCQLHKIRNVLDHLPEVRRQYVRRQMRDAYGKKTFRTAKKLLLQLANWLESNDEHSAAASLREGLDETLTVVGLGLPDVLRRIFSTTNPIENINGTLRRVCRNVKRWRGQPMIRRWIAFGLIEAERKFRRIRGYRQLPILIASLTSPTSALDTDRKVA